jgi:hypothetical protein
MTMETHRARPRRRPRWVELSVALAALVISAVSLYIARQQTEVMHRQLAASIWPAMQFHTSNVRDGEPVISMSVQNVGVGPARVHSFSITHQGEPVADLTAFIEGCCAPEGTSVSTITSFVEGRILPAGEQVDFLTLAADVNHPAVFERFDRVRGELDVEVCYCSVLEECWTRGRGRGEPEPVSSCRG